MKRKRAKTLFLWADPRDEPDSTRKHADGSILEIDPSDKPQIELILKSAPHYKNSITIPYELLIKVFSYVVEASDHPIKDLFCLSRVCEAWRHIVLETPSLWSRIDLTKLPTTDKNILTLDKIFKHCPSIYDNINEVSFSGGFSCKSAKVVEFYETLIGAPNLMKLYLLDIKPQSRNSIPSFISKSINKCRNLRSLSIIQSRHMFTNQKWLADHLTESGKLLEELNLAMSMTAISSQLFKTLGSDFCPRLKVLDISTCDALTTHSFDAVQLAQNMPSLEVLRVANVSFKRVQEAPTDNHNLPRLRELSMPIGMRDADRDDALLGTLAYGSRSILTLDLRGSSVSASALIDMPSPNLKELHIDDTCPLMRGSYFRYIEKWAHSLEVLSLVKVNCDNTVNECLRALIEQGTACKIRELDLSASQVQLETLKEFIKTVKTLKTINLTSCRSLPRGCKALYSKDTRGSLSIKTLMQKLK